jgi:DNA-binding Lrp family transcriptional regulator
MQGVEFEREVFHRLPGVIAELFDESTPPHVAPQPLADQAADFVIDTAGRRWVFEAKTSSSPGVVARAAEQLAAATFEDAIPVVVVPFMTPAGAKVAAERGLNWIDLSGNARLRDEDLYVSVQGRPNQFKSPGRPSSPFAPKSSRVARAILLEPSRWWLQKELAERTDLDPGRVSRIVRRLDDDELLERDSSRLRPRDPDLLLDAWAQDYRFDRHDIVTGHLSGSGVELARELQGRLRAEGVDHAFTGLPAAWAIDGFARFRLVSAYVSGDPRTAADAVGRRRHERGANVQLIGPDDRGVFDGREIVNDLLCVSAVQVYLDLGHLPERAAEAAKQLRSRGGLWHGRA